MEIRENRTRLDGILPKLQKIRETFDKKWSEDIAEDKRNIR